MSPDASTFDEADLNAFADGRLEHCRAVLLAESLAADRQARTRIDGWKRQNDALRTLFASVLFEPVPVRLMPTTVANDGGAAAAVQSTKAPNASGVPAGGMITMMALGIALMGFMAGVLATLATDGFGRGSWPAHTAEARPTDGSVPLAARAVEIYRAILADPARPSEVSGNDGAAVQGWMTEQISAAARIPDLRPEGWTFLGGRMVSGQYDPAAFLTYGLGAERLGLYVARASAAAATRTFDVDDGSVTVTAGSSDAIGYALTSRRNVRRPERDLQVLLDAVRRQLGQDRNTP